MDLFVQFHPYPILIKVISVLIVPRRFAFRVRKTLCDLLILDSDTSFERCLGLSERTEKYVISRENEGSSSQYKARRYVCSSLPGLGRGWEEESISRYNTATRALFSRILRYLSHYRRPRRHWTSASEHEGNRTRHGCLDLVVWESRCCRFRVISRQ